MNRIAIVWIATWYTPPATRSRSHAQAEDRRAADCTKARQLSPTVIQGPDFIAIKQEFHYRTAAPGRKAGSLWQQTLVFPSGKRYFISCEPNHHGQCQRCMFLRLDMPGHLRHQQATRSPRCI